MKQSDRDMLIRIDERVKYLPEIKKDVKRINGSLIEARTKLDDHIVNKSVHSKFGDDLAWPGRLINFVLRVFRIIK